MARVKQETREAILGIYGPDDRTVQLASVAIYGEGRDPVACRDWWGINIHRTQRARREMKAFLRAHGVKFVSGQDSMTGCVHERGVDYPHEGECPFCPWWADQPRNGKAGGASWTWPDMDRFYARGGW